MLRTRRLVFGTVVLAGALALGSCAASVPDPSASIGAEYPAEGIPLSVSWPSDWLEGFVGESPAAGGTIVGLRLEHLPDHGGWVWRVRSADPGRDLLGENVTEPDRGREALIDATSHELLADRHVTLTAAELTPTAVSYYDAAKLSGEEYPSPRLIGLERAVDDGLAVWRITTIDTATGASTEITVDAETPVEPRLR